MNNLVTIEGDYISRADGITDTIGYTEGIVYKESVSKSEARAVAKRLLPAKLKKKDSGFSHLLTYPVKDMKPTEKKAEQPEVVALWLEAISLSCVPDSIDQQRSETAKLEAITIAISKSKKRTEDAGKKKAQDFNLGSAVL